MEELKVINNGIIRIFNPCYDPSEKNIPENETLPVRDWVAKYRVEIPATDILWLLLRNKFMSDKDLRLFAVWCARETLKLDENPDARCINACDVAERFANGNATRNALAAARAAAKAAAKAAARAAARDAARAAAWAAAWDGARVAAWAAAWDAARAAAWAARDAARAAARDAVWDAAWAAARAARDAAWDAQLDYLLKNHIK
jgi:hypothetical protein